MKPFDIVKPKDRPEVSGMITETNNSGEHFIRWFGKNTNMYSAWWKNEDLIAIDNLVNIIGKAMTHPFGSGGKENIDKYYPFTP